MQSLYIAMPRYYFKCSDSGYDCTYEVDGATAEELVPKIKIHAKYAHNMFEVPEDKLNQFKAAIKEKSPE